jgi:hypothetical protein
MKNISPELIIGAVVSIITIFLPNPLSETFFTLVNIIPDGPMTSPTKGFLIVAVWAGETIGIAKVLEKTVGKFL